MNGNVNACYFYSPGEILESVERSLFTTNKPGCRIAKKCWLTFLLLENDGILIKNIVLQIILCA